jgi:hypothetical protein
MGVESHRNAEATILRHQFSRVFEFNCRLIASFEEAIKNIKGQYDYIDILWKAVLLEGHKSTGKNLDKAAAKAFELYERHFAPLVARWKSRRKKPGTA